MMTSETMIGIWVRFLQSGAASMAAACIGFVVYMEREHRRGRPALTAD